MTEKRPGPEEERLTIEGKDWESAFKEAVAHQRPEGGWPKREVKPRKKRRRKAKRK